MYETIYKDTEGRPILVIGELEAFTMVGEAIKEEREACARICDENYTGRYADLSDICAEAIRARGNHD
jgi:hypothetical protein